MLNLSYRFIRSSPLPITINFFIYGGRLTHRVPYITVPFVFKTKLGTALVNLPYGEYYWILTNLKSVAGNHIVTLSSIHILWRRELLPTQKHYLLSSFSKCLALTSSCKRDKNPSCLLSFYFTCYLCRWTIRTQS